MDIVISVCCFSVDASGYCVSIPLQTHVEKDEFPPFLLLACELY